MKRICVGILAHVDAGKTTCVESMLYNAGNIRKMGRVDHQDTFLDYDQQERDRGITIYSKEANYKWNDSEIYILDTPGHVDFSSEMERVLSVLDLAIVLINGQDGVQSHTQTIWKCLEHYKVPTLIFINKMDISYQAREELMEDLITKIHSNCIDYLDSQKDEKLALVNENMLNEYLEEGRISLESIQSSIYKRECFPCFFGSALKNEGIIELMDALCELSLPKVYPDEFGARIFKISSDEKNNRLVHVKITGGTISAKQKLSEEEKIDQIRIYSGRQFTMVDTAEAGMVCALKGLNGFEAGQGLGFEKDMSKPLLNAYMNYELLLPEGVDALQMMRYLNILSSQDPSLEIYYDEDRKKISLSVMGAVQIEVLQKLIKDRTGVSVGFSNGSIVYKETIKESVNGAGHFEPLRHYAEVHVRLEPLKDKERIEIASEVSQDELSAAWQKQILSSLHKIHHKGVLTGSMLTGVKIILTAGKGHLKHTEGQDFYQASKRAVRQALKKAENILLEPYYRFELIVPGEVLSRALYDLETRKAQVEIKDNLDQTMMIKGIGPVANLRNYQMDVAAYTKGMGRFSCELDGYYPCQDQEAIVAKIGYDDQKDQANPSGSVFCAHGAGYYVPWDEADEMMHIQPKESGSSTYQSTRYKVNEEEIKRVFEAAGGRNKKEKKQMRKPKKDLDMKKTTIQSNKESCLIVDGYNMIFAWEELKQLAKENIGMARERLIDLLVNYQGYRGIRLILVFDAYRIKDNATHTEHRANVDIVYTKTSQTADAYIEKAVHDLKGKYVLSVASSDGLIQNAIFTQGAKRISSRELELQVNNVNKKAMQVLKEKYLDK